MKKLKQFKSEQQYITEIGPIGAALMGAMALWGGIQAYKKTKEKIKGYRESQAEKKSNRKYGVEIEIKKIDPDTGEEYSELKTLTGADANLDAEGVEKAQKEAQKKYNNLEKRRDKKAARGKMRAALGMEPDEPMTKDKERKAIAQLKKEKEPPEDGDDTTPTEPEVEPETEPEVDPEQELRSKGDAGEIEDDGEANAYYKLVGKAPTGWMMQKSKTGKSSMLVKKDDIKKKLGGDVKQKPKKNTPAGIESKVLKFGEFIKEDIIKDLKKAIKSKKDFEITLDDGTEMPLDQMTAEILVKYIEGLSSSEKTKTIKQIQRTERAFMKVLGKAHEG